MVMRLYLDEDEGAGGIQCPDCDRPLLLAAERRGRWRVGYDHLFLRVGRNAMLVCPEISCPYREDVQIVGSLEDAVIYSSSRASNLWQMLERVHQMTLGEVRAKLEQLSELYEQTENPKIPSAWRFWRERYRYSYWSVQSALRRGLEEGGEVVLQGKDIYERGRVKELLEQSVLLEKGDTGEPVQVALASLDRVYTHYRLFSKPARFDFSDGSDTRDGNHVIHTPTRFAMVCGYRVGLDSTTRHGLCQIRTDDPETARALGLRPYFGYFFGGEVPAGFVERCFRSIQYCYVQGHRLRLISITKDPDVVQLGTREMETARALKMRQERMLWIGMRKQLRWWRFFRRDEIERYEEKQIPFQLGEMIAACARR